MSEKVPTEIDVYKLSDNERRWRTYRGLSKLNTKGERKAGAIIVKWILAFLVSMTIICYFLGAIIFGIFALSFEIMTEEFSNRISIDDFYIHVISLVLFFILSPTAAWKMRSVLVEDFEKLTLQEGTFWDPESWPI